MIFGQQFCLLFSILLGGLLSERIIFHLHDNYLRGFASTDLQSKYFPLNFQSLNILEYFDIFDFWLPLFVYYLLK